MVLENGAFCLVDVDSETEVGAFYRLEPTVPATEAVLADPGSTELAGLRSGL